MEILIKRLALISLGVFIISTNIFAQDYEKIVEAFEQSYSYETNGEYAKAVEVLKKVYNQDSYEINLRLGWVNYMSGLFTESLGYYKKAIGLKPFSIEAHLGYVYPASALGNWEDVIKHYNEVLEIDPENTLALYRLGNIYYGREEFETALKYFEKVTNLYPFDYDAIIMYAWTNYKTGKLREAKVLFYKALMIQPEDESALEGLSQIQ